MSQIQRLPSPKAVAMRTMCSTAEPMESALQISDSLSSMASFGGLYN
ncbi:hypothetical protein [Dialister hominis]